MMLTDRPLLVKIMMMMLMMMLVMMRMVMPNQASLVKMMMTEVEGRSLS